MLERLHLSENTDNKIYRRLYYLWGIDNGHDPQANLKTPLPEARYIVTEKFEGTDLYVASFDTEKIALMALYKTTGARASIEAFAVDEPFRGQKLGTRALDELVAIAEADGATNVEYLATQDTKSFFEKAGFSHVYSTDAPEYPLMRRVLK